MDRVSVAFYIKTIKETCEHKSNDLICSLSERCWTGTDMKYSSAGLLVLVPLAVGPTRVQLLVFHEWLHDDHGNSLVNDAVK